MLFFIDHPRICLPKKFRVRTNLLKALIEICGVEDVVLVTDNVCGKIT